jgi:hypothetical protein
LPVIIGESAGYARRKADVVHRAKRIIQLPLEAPIHASDQTEASPFQSLKFNGLANAIRPFVRLKAFERCPCFIG